MSSQEESDEYLDDIITLFDFVKTESYEEYDVQDLITIENEVIIDTSCNFNKKVFDKYINSTFKDTSILPYSFCKIQENLEFLDLCRPLSVRVTDCSKYPWYERDMAKIIYNKELEQNIQSKQNNKLLNYKFKEIIGKKYDSTFDANNVTHLNNNSNIKILDIDGKEMSDYLIREDVIYDSKNESQQNCKESSLYVKTDDFIIMDDIEHEKKDHLFDNVNKPKTKIRKATTKTILEPCKKVDCISLSMDVKKKLIHSKKIVPHYHKKKDDKIIKTDLYLNEPKAKCKAIKQHETSLNNMKKPENIQILNEEIFVLNQTPVAYSYVGDEYNLAKYSQQAKKSNNESLLTKQPKKAIKFNSQKKTKKEKQVISIQELQDKYFSNSKRSVNTKGMIQYPSLPNVPTCVEFTPNSTQVCNENVSPNNLSLKGQNILTISGTDKNNLLYPKSNSLLKSKQRYTPYFLPTVGNSYLRYNLASITASGIEIPQPDTIQNNLQTNYEPNQVKYCNIGERKNYRFNIETLLSNNPETSVGVYQPYLYTSPKTYDRSKNNNVELGQRNSLKTSEKNNQQENTKEIDTYTTVHKNGILIANNAPIIKTYQYGNKTSKQETGKMKEICKNTNIEQGNNPNIESLSILKWQGKIEFNNNVINCMDQSFASISSYKIKEVQQEKSSTEVCSESHIFGISQQNKEQKQTYVYDKQQSIATTNNIHQNSHPWPPEEDDIFQNNKTVTGLEVKQINEPTKKSTTDTKVHFNNQEKGYDMSKSCFTCHGIDSTSNAVNIRPNLKEVSKTGTGYSPPILPIPTYQNVFDVLAQVNLMSKFNRNLERRVTNGSVHDSYDETVLANRRITVDIRNLQTIHNIL